jgi:two-component system sensor histidine kinase KdpD
MYDITEAKRAEAQLVQALETEKQASARIRALNEMQHSFLQAVSHDLRTPLTSIVGSALTLARTDIDLSADQSRGLIDGVARNARKLHRLVTDLLDLDRITRGVIAPRRTNVSVTRIISNVLEELPVGDRQVQIRADDPVMAMVDGAQVERIVENLVANALRYTPSGTPIWVSAERKDGGVLVAVDDAGPGVPADVRDQIFEPFRQGDAVAHSPGVGIGLSLVARFAELHDGRAWVEDRPGGGASFKVWLRDGVGSNRPMPATDSERSGSSPDPAGALNA